MNINFLVMDVDGTLTDGKIYMGQKEELFKVFDVRDGYAINSLLKRNGITPVIITGRYSTIVARRAGELNINLVFQDVRDKHIVLKNMLKTESEKDNRQYSFANCAYIGDDIPDIECMQRIKQAGGIAGCPADSAEEVKQVCNFISGRTGGNGAVRDFIDYIIGLSVVTS